jgi:hypothetical protein
MKKLREQCALVLAGQGFATVFKEPFRALGKPWYFSRSSNACPGCFEQVVVDMGGSSAFVECVVSPMSSHFGELRMSKRRLLAESHQEFAGQLRHQDDVELLLYCLAVDLPIAVAALAATHGPHLMKLTSVARQVVRRYLDRVPAQILDSCGYLEEMRLGAGQNAVEMARNSMRWDIVTIPVETESELERAVCCYKIASLAIAVYSASDFGEPVLPPGRNPHRDIDYGFVLQFLAARIYGVPLFEAMVF